MFKEKLEDLEFLRAITFIDMNEEILETIELLCNKHDKTWKEVAEDTGIDYQDMIDILQDERDMTLREVTKIAAQFELFPQIKLISREECVNYWLKGE